MTRTRSRLIGRRSSTTIALAAVSTLALVACGSNNNSPTSTATSAAGQATSAAGQATSGAASAAPAGAITCDNSAAKQLTAAGSSAQANAVDAWRAAYQKECSAQINYQPVGSGAGIQQFLAGTVAFAGSDSALKPEEMTMAMQRCGGSPAVDLPMVTGPIAVAYNLPGVDKLVLDGPTIAGMFSDKVKTWDAPEIKKLNPAAKLPSTAIQAIHRSDESGTTDNFTTYLMAAAPAAWTFGTGKAWKAPGGNGAAKSSGVTQAVQSTEGAVTYVESSFAKNANLPTAAIDTGSGTPVELTADAAAKAVEAAQVVGTGDDLSLKIDYATKAAGAYPIVLVTYEIACTKGLPADQAAAVKSFLTYTSSAGGQMVLNGLSYAPLPSTIQGKVSGVIAKLS